MFIKNVSAFAAPKFRLSHNTRFVRSAYTYQTKKYMLFLILFGVVQTLGTDFRYWFLPSYDYYSSGNSLSVSSVDTITFMGYSQNVRQIVSFARQFRRIQSAQFKNHLTINSICTIQTKSLMRENYCATYSFFYQICLVNFVFSDMSLCPLSFSSRLSVVLRSLSCSSIRPEIRIGRDGHKIDESDILRLVLFT